jgi:uncharacterized cofD-like protein
MPNLIIPDIAQTIWANPCRKIYFCNAMSQPGETDGYSLEDHVRALEKHSFKNPADLVVYNNAPVPEDVLKKYEKMGSYPVQVKEQEHAYQLEGRPLVCLDELGRVRHDPAAVREVVEEILESL